MADPLPQPELTPLPPEDAIAFFRAKGLKPSFNWQDTFQEEHARAFTVAKATNREVLEAIRGEVDAALANGTTFETFREQLEPKLRELGWWGRQTLPDPATGEMVDAQLGSPRRLKLIFSLNLRSAYAAGKWQRIEAAKALAPYLRYVQLQRPSKRDAHAVFHDRIYLVDDPVWDKIYPPCDWQCGCYTQQLNERQMKKRGLTLTTAPLVGPPVRHVNKRTGEVTVLPAGVAPGFGFNIGKAYLHPVAPRPLPSIAQRRLPARAPLEPGDAAEVDAFLETFGLQRGQDRVFTDADGFPLPVGESMLRDAGGELALPASDRIDQLAIAARAIVAPDEIRWLWQLDGAGRRVLVRRYVAKIDGTHIAVDVGKLGWAFRSTDDAGVTANALRVGMRTWARREAEAPAIGQMASEREHVAASLAGRGDRPLLLPIGAVDAQALPAAPGYDVGGFTRILRSFEIRKVMKKHGDAATSAELRQVPLDAGDFELIGRIVRDGSKRFQPQGDHPAGFVHELVIGRYRYTYVERINPRQRSLTLQTFFKRLVR